MARDKDSPTTFFLDTVLAVAGPVGLQAVHLSQGGIQAMVPAFIRSDRHWLVQAVGPEAAEKIVAHVRVLDADDQWMGIRIFIPQNGLGRLQLFKNALLAEAERMLAEGHSARETARFLGLSERSIWRLKARSSAAGSPLAASPTTATVHVVTRSRPPAPAEAPRPALVA